MCIVQESINDEAIAYVIQSSEMGKRGNFRDGISLEIGNDIEGNDICCDWMETFCECNIDDQLNGSVFHLSEMGEECLGIFLVSIFD